uniref:Uncharacterized protein n=1 Tax=Micrurus lemniscatus lemniscatus TaxID=129467 RepID=A0A2D4IU91_MICLE
MQLDFISRLKHLQIFQCGLADSLAENQSLQVVMSEHLKSESSIYFPLLIVQKTRQMGERLKYLDLRDFCGSVELRSEYRAGMSYAVSKPFFCPALQSIH